MTMAEARKTVRGAIALRDAVKAATAWGDVESELAKRGIALEEVRRCLRPKIEFDPHTHTIHSDGILTYRQLLWWCKAVGLRGVGVTDHDNIHPSIADALEEAERLGLRLVPGLEFTVHTLGGQNWCGLEVGLHFFPSARFADFIRSKQGLEFRKRFDESNALKSEQGWAALDAANERLLAAKGLRPIERDELWEASGRVDPVLVGTLTVLILARFFDEGRQDLLDELPNTRAIYTHLNKRGLVPRARGRPQTFDDIIAIRTAVAEHGIRSTITLNHPEEWLTKCGLVTEEGNPDLPAIRRLVALMALHEPRRAPVSFLELYTSRNTPVTRRLFEALFEEFRELRERCFPSIPEMFPIASTDAHRVSGFLDEAGEAQGWVPGEDFIFGMGMVDEDHPGGNLDVPDDYPGAEEILERMEQCAR